MSSKPGLLLQNPELSGPAKSDEIARLLEILDLHFQKKNLNPSGENDMNKLLSRSWSDFTVEHTDTLSRLKILTRTANNAEPLFYKEAVETLCQHSFENGSPTSSREALKCLANVLLLEAKTRQMFVDLGYATNAVDKLKNDNREDELLCSRVLFLLTYETNMKFDHLFDHHNLIDIINTNIGRHSNSYSKSPKNTMPSNIEMQALSETLKFFFNLTQFYPGYNVAFSEPIPHILTILTNIQLPTPMLQPPITYLINSLLNLDIKANSSNHMIMSALFPNLNSTCHLNRLITILDSSVRYYKDEELESLATPLVAILRKIYAVAPALVKEHMEISLLPSVEERAKPLGRSDTLASWLLRLSTSPVAPSLRESISSLMFEVSDQDPALFVRNVGYGFASGFLMTHNLPVPEKALKGDGKTASIDDTEDPGEMVTYVDGLEINPITGQRKDMEPVDLGPEMTDDEKEKEAEKLFVLFERLKATGVMDVVNPVEQALREGRFEELG